MVHSHYHETCANTHLVSGEMYYAVAFLYQNGMGSLVRKCTVCLQNSYQVISKAIKSSKVWTLYLEFFLSSAFVFSEAKYNLF